MGVINADIEQAIEDDREHLEDIRFHNGVRAGMETGFILGNVPGLYVGGALSGIYASSVDLVSEAEMQRFKNSHATQMPYTHMKENFLPDLQEKISGKIDKGEMVTDPEDRAVLATALAFLAMKYNMTDEVLKEDLGRKIRDMTPEEDSRRQPYDVHYSTYTSMYEGADLMSGLLDKGLEILGEPQNKDEKNCSKTFVNRRLN